MTRKASPTDSRAAAAAIVRRLREAGHVALFAGGCVRDELLGLSPTDYDVACDAAPDQVRALFRRTVPVGAAFGVVLVTPGPDEGAPAPATVEVATFRADGPYTDRRRPDAVTFSTPQADAQRRDFTVNALFFDPGEGGGDFPGATIVPRDGGRVIDFVGGMADLDRRTLRAVGDPEARLAEDHLRALRAVRLGARLGFSIEQTTAAAIAAHARDLRGVSRERIGEELRRMMAHPSRAESARILESMGLDAPVLDERTRQSDLTRLRGLEGRIPFATALAAWMLDRGQEVTGPGALGRALTRIGMLRSALCLSNAERDQLAGTFRSLAALADEWDAAPVARQKRLAGAPDGGFMEAVRLISMADPARADDIRARVQALAATHGGLAPEPLLTGDHLVAMGMKPGRPFKAILDRVYDAQLESRITDPEQAAAMARELAASSGV